MLVKELAKSKLPKRHANEAHPLALAQTLFTGFRTIVDRICQLCVKKIVCVAPGNPWERNGYLSKVLSMAPEKTEFCR